MLLGDESTHAGLRKGEGDSSPLRRDAESMATTLIDPVIVMHAAAA